MTRATIATWIIWAIGGFQVIANAAMLIRGRSRLPVELAQSTPRVAELLKTSWLYGSLANLGLGVVLILEAPEAVHGNRYPEFVVGILAANYIVFAAASYREHRRAGMLGFAAMGVALYIALLL